MRWEDDCDNVPFAAFGSRSRPTGRTVRHRPDQQAFKFAVLRRYGTRCPLSGVQVPEMLESAHLIPDSQGGSSGPRNGLVLNAALHRAFDAGLFAINPDTLTVETTPDGPTLQDMGIHMPSIAALAHQPHPDTLRWRYQWWTATHSS
ncbi:HNH endonuclease [Spirillospora sp. NPDC127200]